MAASALPETLKSVTATKIEELTIQRNLFEEQKASLFKAVSQQRDPLSKAQCLLDGTCRINNIRLPSEASDIDDNTAYTSEGPVADQLRNKHFLLRQAAADPAIAEPIINDVRAQLEHDFIVKTTQHMHAKFFSELVTEWLSEPDDFVEVSQPNKDDPSLDQMQEQRQIWEETVFSQSSVDTDKIEAYLEKLFSSTKQIKRSHESLVKSTHHFCAKLTEQRDVFSPEALAKYIKGLLDSDLLSEERMATLKTFNSNKEVMKEVSDVLNMRWQSLDKWQWTKINGAIPVEMRKQLNGKYRVFMDEDVLDAILLYVVGLKFSVYFRTAFGVFVQQAFKQPSSRMSTMDRARRTYYLGNDDEPQGTVAKERHKMYMANYLLTQLPSDENVGKRNYDDDDDGSHRRGKTQKSPMALKHGLLHMLVADALISQHIDPASKHTVVRSDFKWFGPSIPHATIQTVLKFFGVEQNWLDFFERFLHTSLRFSQDGPDSEIRVRSCGVPMSHTLSDVFGETILFVMDFGVNEATSSYMYRLHDDFWFWGSEEVCIKAWQAMTTFAKTMGLEFNEEKTGTVTLGEDETSKQLPQGEVKWGFLKLDSSSCTFSVNREMVGEHVKALRLQLSYCKSIFSYLQCYNAYLARFFTNNLGQPSIGFGHNHVDMIVETFQVIQKALFPGGSVTTYLAERAKKQFGIDDLPTGFWYWPVDLGGLELQNPIVPMIATRETMRQSPQGLLERALDDDERLYALAKEEFLRLNTGSGLGKRNSKDSEIQRQIAASREEFMPEDEFMRYRLERSFNLGTVYCTLIEVPKQQNIANTADIETWAQTIRHDGPKHISQYLNLMTPYWKCILALHGKEIVEKYDSLQMVDQEKVPIGVVSLIKSGKMRWKG